MTTTKLREILEALLPSWKVTINEQTMLNVGADDYDQFQGFAYVEEFCTSRTSYARFGREVTHTHDIYLCVLDEFDLTAEQREAVRESRLYPVMESVEAYLNRFYGVLEFDHDLFPRGFDANEILVHIRFRTSEKIC